MVWKVRVDCTYTKPGAKKSRQEAAQEVLDAFPAAKGAGNGIPAGLVSQSKTRFTVAVDVVDGPTAQALAAELTAALTAAPRSQTLISIHDGG